MVSEHTRRIAHELDDKHREWILLRKDDALADALEPEPLLGDLLTPNHLAMLTDYENAEANYMAIREHRRRIENRMVWLKKDKANLLRTYSASDVGTHIYAAHSELVYIEKVQLRLKQVLKATRVLVRSDVIQDALGLESSMAAHVLAELFDVVSKAVNANDIEIIRAALAANDNKLWRSIGDVIVRASRDIAADESNRVLVDSVVAQRWELEE